MVCIAAFIILCILSVFVAILSIFKRDLGKKYWKVFKKSWGCVGKKVTLQKCETNFKDDIKNSLLSKVVIKKPKLVKPLSVTIEIASVLIVLVTLWSLVTAVKSGLSLWTFGTCNVAKPSSCSLGAEACGIDQEEPKNIIESLGLWFSEWGEIFSAIPDKIKNWDASEYASEDLAIYGGKRNSDKPLAIDILDPGCVACMQSLKNQIDSGFVDSHDLALLPYPIPQPDGSGYKFKNSGIITRYLFAINVYQSSSSQDYSFNSWTILEKIFTEYNADHIIYQNIFNEKLDETETERLLQAWLKDLGLDEPTFTEVIELVYSQAVTQKMSETADIVENQIRAKGIPCMIYDGKKHTGLFKTN